MLTPEKLAKLFHDTYEEVIQENERQAKSWLPSGSKAWDDIPVIPRRLFVEVCRRVLKAIDAEDEPINRKWK